MSNRWVKDPSDVTDFVFDFAPLENGNGDSNWLDRASSPIEAIVSKTITPDSGITVDSSSITDNSTSVTVVVSGGTAGATYKVLCEIVTASQTKQKTAYITVTNQ